MKTILASTIFIPVYQYPTYFLIVAIALVFVVDLLKRYQDSRQITCDSVDWNAYSYRDIQAYAKSHGIKANQKKQTLISLLQEV
jgi:hypothetical protein